MSRKIQFSEKEFYHIYNRGVDKRIVFAHDSDMKRFALLLYLCNGRRPVHFDALPEWRGSTSRKLIETVFSQERGKPLVAIGAYCLMPNHFHLLVREITEGGISVFMHKLSTAYTMYFNTSRKRTGALFQGRFKAEHVTSETHLKYLFSYIHLNPIKLIAPKWRTGVELKTAKAKRFLSSYTYSSYLDYLGTERKFLQILERKEFPDYFPTSDEVEKHIYDWLEHEDSATSPRG